VERRIGTVRQIKKLTIGLPARPLTNFDLEKKLSSVSSFVGVFMRDQLTSKRRRKCECGIVNLNTQSQPGSHWVAYYVRGTNAVYFDSYGNLRPPPEIVNYLGKDTIIAYNDTQYQSFNSVICGHLCIAFIYIMNEKYKNQSCP